MQREELRLKKFFFQHISFDIRLLAPKKFHLKKDETFFGIFYRKEESTNSN